MTRRVYLWDRDICDSLIPFENFNVLSVGKLCPIGVDRLDGDAGFRLEGGIRRKVPFKCSKLLLFWDIRRVKKSDAHDASVEGLGQVIYDLGRRIESFLVQPCPGTRIIIGFRMQNVGRCRTICVCRWTNWVRFGQPRAKLGFWCSGRDSFYFPIILRLVTRSMESE